MDVAAGEQSTDSTITLPDAVAAYRDLSTLLWRGDRRRRWVALRFITTVGQSPGGERFDPESALETYSGIWGRTRYSVADLSAQCIAALLDLDVKGQKRLERLRQRGQEATPTDGWDFVEAKLVQDGMLISAARRSTL